MFSVFIPVGPADAELERLADTIDSLRAHTRREQLHLILVDDSPRPRALERYEPGAEVVRTAVWDGRVPDPLSAITAGTIEALRHSRGEFALKLDTDALVIAPFADSIRSVLSGDAAIGLIGACDRAAGGGQRDWSMWPALIRRATWPIRAVRTGRLWPEVSFPGRRERRRVRAIIRAAAANPSYSLGAHCLGAAYAVSPHLLGRTDLLDWRPWVRTRLSEDVLLGLLCAAAGLRMHGMVNAHEPFAVAWRGLPAAPQALIERGHSIIHSVKDCTYGTEEELRTWFRTHAR